MFAVDHRVDGDLFTVFFAALSRAAEVEAREQFPDHQNIQVLHVFGLHGGGIEQSRRHTRGAQVGPGVEQLPQVEQRALGPLHRGQVVEGRVADRAEQHRVRLAGRLSTLLGKGDPRLTEAGGSKGVFP